MNRYRVVRAWDRQDFNAVDVPAALDTVATSIKDGSLTNGFYWHDFTLWRYTEGKVRSWIYVGRFET